MDLNRCIDVYVKIRDARAERKRAFEAEDEKLKEQQKQIEGVLLKHLIDTGCDSAKTQAGTFYRTEVLKPSGSDWQAFYEWIRENDAFDFLERRIKRDEVKAYMEMHDGALPPGVSVFKEYEVRVRRAN